MLRFSNSQQFSKAARRNKQIKEKWKFLRKTSFRQNQFLLFGETQTKNNCSSNHITFY